MNQNRKQSILLGGLISSAGIFISKFLGLLYVVPFNTLLGSAANQSYYAQTYGIYSYVLNVATAGLPYAIATLIARYATRKDYRTCLLVKKVSFYTMAAFGFICMSVMILCSGMIAESVCPSDADINIMRNCIILISIAVFVIPILSSLRGFYQGLKELELYSTSQIMEQLARIFFLLGMGFVMVYIFQQDQVWAVYFGVIAATVSGGLTIFYLQVKGKAKTREIKKLARVQEIHNDYSAKMILSELMIVAVPFLLTSIFGYCDGIINQMDLKPGMEVFGQMAYTDELSSAVFMHATKIIAIPMILAPGFGAAIIPYITSAIEHKKIKLVRKYILDCVNSVVYIALPVCFALFVFAQPVMFTLFGNANLELDSFVMQWFALEALCSTICPIFSSIVTTIGMRKRIILHTMIFALIKLLTNRFFIGWFGVPGMVLSSFLAYVVFTALNVFVIQKYYHVSWKFTLRKILVMALGIAAFYIVSLPFAYLGWINYTDSRLLSMVYLGIMGCVCCLAYVGVTAFFQVPQSIFHFSISSIIKKLQRK